MSYEDASKRLRQSGAVDQSVEMKGDLKRRVEGLVDELGQLSKLVVLGSGAHDRLLKVAKGFAALDGVVGSTEQGLRRTDMAVRRMHDL